MVGDKIKSERDSLGITQRELAEIAHISRTSMSRIENNKVPNIRLGTALKIAMALKIRADYLFCDYRLQNEAH